MNTEGLVSIDLMPEHIRRAWASTNTSGVGNCPASPTHFLIFRGRAGKRTRQLACTQHANEAAEKRGLSVKTT